MVYPVGSAVKNTSPNRTFAKLKSNSLFLSGYAKILKTSGISQNIGLKMRRKRLPKVQYTLREISCGIQFLGFADERSNILMQPFLPIMSMSILKSMDSLLKQVSARPIMALKYCGLWSATKPSLYPRNRKCRLNS